jgi:transposase
MISHAPFQQRGHRLYWYGYLQQVRSSRRLEAECQRNLEVMWLLGRLQPDYKSIAEFRRIHSASVTRAGAELVRFARSVGLVGGKAVAVDGSKFQAVSSARGVREREAIARYRGTDNRQLLKSATYVCRSF